MRITGLETVAATTKTDGGMGVPAEEVCPDCHGKGFYDVGGDSQGGLDATPSCAYCGERKTDV